MMRRCVSRCQCLHPYKLLMNKNSKVFIVRNLSNRLPPRASQETLISVLSAKIKTKSLGRLMMNSRASCKTCSQRNQEREPLSHLTKDLMKMRLKNTTTMILKTYLQSQLRILMRSSTRRRCSFQSSRRRSHPWTASRTQASRRWKSRSQKQRRKSQYQSIALILGS